MSTQVTLQPAYLLHARPYRETSALAEVLTRDFGRISLVIKGMRQARSRYRGVRPFTSLLISCQGKSDLFNLTDLETTGMPYPLEGDNLFCGFYLNELLIRLLHPQDPYPFVFSGYQETLQALSENPKEVEPVLRQFELLLLTALGYGFALDETADKMPVLKENDYFFDPGRGLIKAPVGLQSTFKGACLLNFRQNQWSDPETRLTAKRLMQLALAPLLGKKPLKTRAVFKEAGLH